MHRAVSGIVDQIVDHQRLPAALDQRIALDIMRPDIAIEDDARRIVVDQRPLAMPALGMARDGEALAGELVPKTAVVTLPILQLLAALAWDARAGHRPRLVVHSPERPVINSDLLGRQCGKGVDFPPTSLPS